MRLLDTHTGQFVEKDPRDQDAIYAILSHTWCQDPPEQTYSELREIQKRYIPRLRPETHNLKIHTHYSSPQPQASSQSQNTLRGGSTRLSRIYSSPSSSAPALAPRSAPLTGENMTIFPPQSR